MVLRASLSLECSVSCESFACCICRWLNSPTSLWFWLISKKMCVNPIRVSDKTSRAVPQSLCWPQQGWGVCWRLLLLRSVLWRGQELLKGLSCYLCCPQRWAGGISHVGAGVSHIYGNPKPAATSALSNTRSRNLLIHAERARAAEWEVITSAPDALKIFFFPCRKGTLMRAWCPRWKGWPC